MSREFDIKGATLEGVMLIDASAGTGKTYAISALVVRLLLEKELEIDEILVVTFTEAAVDDLKTRIRQKIIEAITALGEGASGDGFLAQLLREMPVEARPRAVRRLTTAMRNFDEAAIFTIHGFCRRVLSEHSLESGVLFDSELITSQRDLILEIIEDFFRLSFYGVSPLLAAAYFKDFAPVNLLKKLGNIHARTDVRVIPAVDGLSCLQELERVEAEYRRLFQEVSGRWPEKRARVASILLAGDALNRTRYPPKSISGWLVAMDRLTAMAAPPVELFGKFSKFTTSSLGQAVNKGKEVPADDFFELCEKLYDGWLQLTAVLTDYAIYLETEFYSFVRQELTLRKEAVGVHSFDDLLTDLHLALKSDGGAKLARLLNARYPAALIDEFQDTDPLQYEIFSRVFNGSGSLLYLIGDPKQAIYSFRGADIFAYIQAVREIDNRYTLGENWRSVPGLVASVNAIFSGRAIPFVFQEIVFTPARAAEKPQQRLLIDDVEVKPFHLWAFQREGQAAGSAKLLNKDEARELVLVRQAAEVVRLLSHGRGGRAMIDNRSLTAGDLAILVRTNYEARLVKESLAGVGVASAINSSENLFASREAVELRIVLQAMLDAGDSRRTRAALATRLLGGDGGVLDLFGEDSGVLVDWLGKFRRYQGLWNGAGFAAMFGAFLENEGVRSRLLLLPGGERSLTNVLHLLETLHLAGEEGGLGMVGLVKYLGERIASAEEQPADELQLRLESEADLVQIVTIHKAKGLQYPVVFCPFCWEGSRLADKKNKKKSVLFHNPRGNGELILDIGSAEIDNNRVHAIREELAENLRILYVALTRAIHCCYLAWGPFSGAGTSALAYLLHGESPEDVGTESFWTGDCLQSKKDGELEADLERLAARSGGNIILDFGEPNSSAEALDSVVTPGFLACRKFAASAKTDWRISSFSALSRKLQPDHLRNREDERTDDDFQPAPAFGDMMDFPRGAGPGTFLHALLEDLDFSTADFAGPQGFLPERLVAGGYDASWAPALAAMLGNLLKTPLDPAQPDLILASVAKTARLNELEFYFPLVDFDPAVLEPYLDGWPISEWQVEKIRGFMKGYIDLVFCHDEKFYIVDWKSNFLGRSLSNYLPENLRKVMNREHYSLQYLIYTVALHRYLARRMPGYSYEENFGGVFYVFLRGVGREVGVDSGIYRDRPPVALVRNLSNQFG